jgi:hypothetical protein
MAKRTPRSEAEDTTIAAGAPARPQNPSAGGSRPDAAEGRGRARTERSAATEAPPETSESPTEEEIRYRAYLLYIERGGGHGMDFEDWVTAERELKNRR